jgi:hypothetical protein
VLLLSDLSVICCKVLVESLVVYSNHSEERY